MKKVSNLTNTNHSRGCLKCFLYGCTYEKALYPGKFNHTTVIFVVIWKNVAILLVISKVTTK